jgi:hypothetical protein
VPEFSGTNRPHAASNRYNGAWLPPEVSLTGTIKIHVDEN